MWLLVKIKKTFYLNNTNNRFVAFAFSLLNYILKCRIVYDMIETIPCLEMSVYTTDAYQYVSYICVHILFMRAWNKYDDYFKMRGRNQLFSSRLHFRVKRIFYVFSMCLLRIVFTVISGSMRSWNPFHMEVINVTSQPPLPKHQCYQRQYIW